MKTLMKNGKALIICLIALFGIAAVPADVVVSNEDNKVFVLSVDNTSSPVVVTLENSKGRVLQNDRVRKNELASRNYLLSSLPVGEYKLFVKEGAKTTSHVLIVNEGSIRSPKHLTATYFAPAIVLNDDKLDFTMLALHETLVTIEIKDEEGRVNYSNTTCEKGSVQRRFDVSDLGPGSYTITTNIEGQHFEEEYVKAFTIPGYIAGF